MALALAMVLTLGGCASTPRANTKDPLERLNRNVSEFNDVVDRAVLKPAATAYQRVTPALVRTGASNFFGNKLVNWWHALLNRIPIVRSIYSGVKQVSDTLFSESGNAFRKAVLVQWPREDVWTIAFVTGSPGGDVVNHLQGDYLSVYVPTTPNPTGGYFVMLKTSECIELKMSVDEALKYIVSMGVVVPYAHVPTLIK